MLNIHLKVMFGLMVLFYGKWFVYFVAKKKTNFLKNMSLSTKIVFIGTNTVSRHDQQRSNAIRVDRPTSGTTARLSSRHISIDVEVRICIVLKLRVNNNIYGVEYNRCWTADARQRPTFQEIYDSVVTALLRDTRPQKLSLDATDGSVRIQVCFCGN